LGSFKRRGKEKEGEGKRESDEIRNKPDSFYLGVKIAAKVNVPTSRTNPHLKLQGEA